MTDAHLSILISYLMLINELTSLYLSVNMSFARHHGFQDVLILLEKTVAQLLMRHLGNM